MRPSRRARNSIGVRTVDDRPQVLGRRRRRRGQQRQDPGDRRDELVVDGRGDLDVGGHESRILGCRVVTPESKAARQLGSVLEPVTGQVYFSPECHRNYEALGFAASQGEFGGVAGAGRPGLLHEPRQRARTGSRHRRGGRRSACSTPTPSSRP